MFASTSQSTTPSARTNTLKISLDGDQSAGRRGRPLCDERGSASRRSRYWFSSNKLVTCPPCCLGIVRHKTKGWTFHAGCSKIECSYCHAYAVERYRKRIADLDGHWRVIFELSSAGDGGRWIETAKAQQTHFTAFMRWCKRAAGGNWPDAILTPHFALPGELHFAWCRRLDGDSIHTSLMLNTYLPGWEAAATRNGFRPVGWHRFVTSRDFAALLDKCGGDVLPRKTKRKQTSVPPLPTDENWEFIPGQMLDRAGEIKPQWLDPDEREAWRNRRGRDSEIDAWLASCGDAG